MNCTPAYDQYVETCSVASTLPSTGLSLGLLTFFAVALVLGGLLILAMGRR
jgi:hypothetical protein